MSVVAACFLACGGPRPEEVVVYVSLDQVYSEPILARFEQRSGLGVRAAYDTEATKTTGLANRLIAERGRPQADVFWNSEIVRTLVLEREGVLDAYVSPVAADIPAAYRDAEGYWTGFAARVRVLAVTPSLPRKEWPATVAELAAGGPRRSRMRRPRSSGWSIAPPTVRARASFSRRSTGGGRLRTETGK